MVRKVGQNFLYDAISRVRHGLSLIYLESPSKIVPTWLPFCSLSEFLFFSKNSPGVHPGMCETGNSLET